MRFTCRHRKRRRYGGAICRCLRRSARSSRCVDTIRPGSDYPPEAYVFGDTACDRVKSVKTAWANAVLKAHGIEPVREKNGRLTTRCQQRLAVIDLNFHDLRRESGSRFLEHGMAPHYVQAFLDHANLSTTSRYLNITSQGMHAALKRVEEAQWAIVRPRSEEEHRVTPSHEGLTRQ